MCIYMCVCLVAQSCPTLCSPMHCGPLSSSVHGILQARILEWVAISFSRGSPLTQGSKTNVSCTSYTGRQALYMYLYMQILFIISDSVPPYDCSPPGSSVHGILQVGILEWFALPSSRDKKKEVLPFVTM